MKILIQTSQLKEMPRTLIIVHTKCSLKDWLQTYPLPFNHECLMPERLC